MATVRKLLQRPSQRGFGYMLVLFALAAMGVVLAGAGQAWRHAAQRDRETELLFIGGEFGEALHRYRSLSPPGTPTAPERLEDLVEDNRFANPVRHLRRIYRDPMTGQAEWGLVIAGGRVVGVHSLSDREALRIDLPSHVSQAIAPQTDGTYASWVFAAARP